MQELCLLQTVLVRTIYGSSKNNDTALIDGQAWRSEGTKRGSKFNVPGSTFGPLSDLEP